MDGFENIGAVKAKKMIDSNSCKVLDVRTSEEFDEIYIDTAISLPLDEIYEEVENVFPNKDEQILVYCSAGKRSLEACDIMVKKGYTNVFNLSGGLMEWPFELIM